MKILHISDTHACHDQLSIPSDIDLVIHSGDVTNPRCPYQNEPEMYKFLEWYAALEVPNKVFVAGNHDTSLEKGLITAQQIKDMGINYLYNDSVVIEGLKIWGSPYTPTFGLWAFMKSRAKIGRVWEQIPDDVDIIVTHGPPKGFLDITNRGSNLQEQCGCISLTKRVLSIQPKLVCFGHIHNGKNIYNAGIKQVAGLDTIFSNGSCSTDGMMGTITSHGNRIEL